MPAKIKILSRAVAAIVIAQSVNASAIEPPNMKRITDEDKIYFWARLNQEQLEKLRRVFNHRKSNNQPCLKAAEISKTLRFIKDVTPIFREASTSIDISSYARKYSASLVKELVNTSKALKEDLPRQKNACSAINEAASRSE